MILLKTKREVYQTLDRILREAVAEMDARRARGEKITTEGYARIKADVVRLQEEAWANYRPYAKKKRVA